ncbi:hypothetical protein M2160_001729 [Streptomyces sp. SAI-117]|nr:hypothetical protein [Streptomyces sp. SAI-117]
MQAPAGPEQVDGVVQVVQDARQFTGEGAEAIGDPEPFGPVPGPLQQRLGPVDGDHPGPRERLGEQTGQHSRPAPRVDDQPRLGLLVPEPGQGPFVEGGEQFGLGLQVFGHRGPVDVGALVIVVVVVRHGASLSSGCGQRAPTHRGEASDVAVTARTTAKQA